MLLAAVVVTHPALPLAECLHQAIRTVRDLHDGDCDSGHRASPTSTVIAVRTKADALEYLVPHQTTFALLPTGGVGSC
ncbi:hypothetical protein ACH4S8_01340 [Streptomyces sp. NPDC021080]|uniref:hypothetical protein n=1 Tax=Streptomyces sp. NPDC021080 TaxID=3365110 RepID=UPI0037BD5437